MPHNLPKEVKEKLMADMLVFQSKKEREIVAIVSEQDGCTYRKLSDIPNAKGYGLLKDEVERWIHARISLV